MVTGTSFTGTIVCTYKERTSKVPEISEIAATGRGSDNGTTATDYSTSIEIDRSGEGDGLIGMSIPVTSVADIHTINQNLTAVTESEKSYRPFLNTAITVPGKIGKRSDGQYVLMEPDSNGNYNSNDDNHTLFINTDQLPEVNLENYIGLEGIFTGLLTKRDGSAAKLVIVRSAFFEAEELDVFLLDETLPEGRVADRYSTGALSNKVNVKIHRKGWTVDTWGTICLPFDMTAEEFEATFKQSITALAECSGTVENSALKFNLLNTKEIKAGVPYLIQVSGEIKEGTGKTETDENYYATIENRLITVPVPKVVNVEYDKNPVIGSRFEFRGLFGKKTEASETNEAGGHDQLAGNQKYQYISTIKPQYLHYLPTGSKNGFAGLRAYLYFPDWDAALNNDTKPNNGTQNTVLTISFVYGTTGVSSIAADDAGDGKVFNLSGQCVGHSAAGLAKGIYIRNGKKFAVN